MMVEGEGVKGYDKGQVVLVIPDLTTFGVRVLVTLGTSTINQIVNIIKESERDELSISLSGLRISHLLARHQAELSFKNGATASQTPGPTDMNEAVKTMKREEIEAFSYKIVDVHTKMVLLGNIVCNDTSPKKGEEPCLLHGLNVVNTYTKMTTGSRHVIKNQTAVPVIICKGIKATLVVAANRVPPVEVRPGTLEKLDDMQGIWLTRMSIEHRKEPLLQQLDLSGLDGWSRTNHTSSYALLTEYHDIF